VPASVLFTGSRVCGSVAAPFQKPSNTRFARIEFTDLVTTWAYDPNPSGVNAVTLLNPNGIRAHPIAVGQNSGQVEPWPGSKGAVDFWKPVFPGHGFGNPTDLQQMGTGFGSYSSTAAEPLGIRLLPATDDNGNAAGFVIGSGQKREAVTKKLDTVRGNVDFGRHNLQYIGKGFKGVNCTAFPKKRRHLASHG
jgi:hypothetical protein